jgi:alpha-ketoglutaric semialdehyde dehydrogenase
MTELHHRTQFVDGAWTPPTDDDVRASINPTHPSTVVAHWEPVDPQIVTGVVARARRAAGEWERQGPGRRAAVLDSVARTFDAAREELAALIVAEVGKPHAEAVAEVALAGDVARFYAQLSYADAGSVTPSATGLSFTRRRPLGVIAAITPFNFPLSIPVWKLMPALSVGNAVIWKPSPAATEIAARTTELIAGLFPPGVVTMLLGGSESVGSLIDAGVDGLTFTGSTEVGLALASRCAAVAIRFQGEFGGKNASVVLADADLSTAARACAVSAFAYAGQKCTATSRLIVEERAWDDFFDALRREINALSFGDPTLDHTVVGPVIDVAAHQRLTAAFEDTREGHDLLVLREPPDGDGLFVPLGVVGSVDATSDLAQRELFGPLVAAIAVPDLDGAISAANATPYGLAVAIHTRDLDAALRFASEARGGIVRVNRTTTGIDYAQPFGGEGRSGIGPRELGFRASEFATSEQTIWMGASQP